MGLEREGAQGRRGGEGGWWGELTGWGFLMGSCRCRVGRRFFSLTGEKKRWERSLRIHGSSPVGGLISFILSGLPSGLDDFFLISLSRKISTFVSIHFVFLLSSYTCQ